MHSQWKPVPAHHGPRWPSLYTPPSLSPWMWATLAGECGIGQGVSLQLTQSLKGPTAESNLLTALPSRSWGNNSFPVGYLATHHRVHHTYSGKPNTCPLNTLSGKSPVIFFFFLVELIDKPVRRFPAVPNNKDLESDEGKRNSRRSEYWEENENAQTVLYKSPRVRACLGGDVELR